MITPMFPKYFPVPLLQWGTVHFIYGFRCEARPPHRKNKFQKIYDKLCSASVEHFKPTNARIIYSNAVDTRAFNGKSIVSIRINK